MRRLIRRLRGERGASAVTFGLLLIPLLGFAGIAVDVGALYAEKAELQNGADAAALQVALECGEDELSAACLSAMPTDIAGGNDSSDGIEDIQDVSVDTTANVVTVTTNTEDLGVRHPLASMIPGIGDSTVVTAIGAAEWGSPTAGRSIALAIDICHFYENSPTGAAPGDMILLRYDENASRMEQCETSAGGFGWLENGPDVDCEVDLEVGDVSSGYVDAPGTTGNAAQRAGCQSSYLETLLGETLLVPVYSELTGVGSATTYKIEAFAALEFVDFRVTGSDRLVDPTGANTCNGECRGILGRFVTWVTLDEYVELGDGGVETGASVVRLTLP